MELEIVKYIKEHGLDKTIKDFKLDLRDYGHKILLKYNMIYSPMNRIEVQEARGLILEKGTWKIMCLPFKRFFNSEEPNAAKIDWGTAQVFEKIDGSLSTLYYDWVKNEWRVSTSGMAEAEGLVNNKDGLTFAQLFWETIEKIFLKSKLDFQKKLLPGFCYPCELTGPYNIIITPHKTSCVTLLTVRNLESLEEKPYDVAVIVAKSLNIPIVKCFDLNVKNAAELKKTFDGMPFFEEGYVVRDHKDNRVKVKNPAYLAAHMLKSKSSEYHILDIVKSNEVEEYASTFIERKEEIYKLSARYNELLTQLENTWVELQNHLPKNITAGEKKKFAMAVFDICKKNNVVQFSSLYFNLKDGKSKSIREYIMDFDNRKLYQILK